LVGILTRNFQCSKGEVEGTRVSRNMNPTKPARTPVRGYHLM
jgi:hypothetical protein